MDLTRAGLRVGDEAYLLGDTWWVLGALAILSVVAVFRLAFGRRDWLATLLAAGWVVVASAYAIGTREYSFLALAVLIFILVATGTARDRRLSN